MSSTKEGADTLQLSELLWADVQDEVILDVAQVWHMGVVGVVHFNV